MPVSNACFRAHFERLTDNYLSSADVGMVRGRRQLYSELLARHEWIDEAVFVGAVQETLDTVQRFLPGTAEFLAICEFVQGEQARAGRKALPPPAPPAPLGTGTRPSNAALLRNIAIGKLAARAGRHMTGGTWDGPLDFTDQEVQDVVDAMARRREFEGLRALPADAPAQDALAALGIGKGGATVVGEWPRDGAQ